MKNSWYKHLNNLRPHNKVKDERGFIIFSQQRSGTHFLASLLNSHDKIRAMGECFRVGFGSDISFREFMVNHIKTRKIETWDDIYWVPWLKFMENSRSGLAADSKTGFILMYNQLQLTPPFFSRRLLSQYRIIHLHRENHLRRHVSDQINRLTGYATTKTKAKLNRISLQTDNLIEELNCSVQNVDRIRTDIKPKAHIEVCYENLIENTQTESNKIVQFLGLKPTIFSTNLKITNPFPLSEILINFYEVETKLKGSSFEKYLYS